MSLEKIKGLKGILYRKVKEAAEKKEREEALLPGFAIQKPKRLIEFPEVKDIRTINITYPLIEPFAYVNIKWDPTTKELMYNVIEPKLTEGEAKILEKISDGLIELVDVELTAIKQPSKAIEYLEKNVLKVINQFGIKLSPIQFVKIMYYIYRNFIGYNEIETLLQDPNIEDISCDGVATPIYIIHRKFGSLKTNIIFKNEDNLREFVIKLAERCGRYVSYAEPILAGTLPDGSRVSATLAGDVATRGPTFCIQEGFVQFNDGNLKKISSFFEESKKNSRVEVMDGAEILRIKNKEVLGVYQKLKQDRAKILTVIKLPPPEKLVDIELEDGKRITVTQNHLFHVVGKNGLELVKAENLSEDSYIPVPTKIELKGKVQNVNVLNVLQNYPTHVAIRINKKIYEIVQRFIEKKYTTKRGIDRKSLSRRFGVNNNYFYDILSLKSSSISASVFLKICDELNIHPKFDELEIILKTKKGYGGGKVAKVPLKLDEKLAYIIGLIISDGSLTKDYFSIRLYGAKKQLIEKVEKYLKDLFGKCKSYGNQLYVANKFVCFYINEVFNVPIGKKSRSVKVPEIIMKSPNSIISAFIQGLFDGDGSVVNSLNYKTYSKELAYALPFLLARLGVYSTIREKTEKERFRILIPPLYEKVFLKKIGFKVDKKRKILEQRIKKRKGDVHRLCGRMPNLTIVRNLVEKNGIKISTVIKKCAISSSILYNETLPKNLVKKILDMIKMETNGNLKGTKEFEYLSWLCNSDNEFVKVKSVKLRENSEKLPVYDIELNPTKFFIGGLNGPLNLFDTIRKFTEKPISPVEQLNYKTISAEALAYFWYLVEHGASILIVGGVATGKCIAPNDFIQLGNGEVKPIKEVYERVLKGNPHSVELMTLTPDLKLLPVRVNKFWKLESPDLLVDVETSSGCKITTTPEHDFFCLKDGKIERIRSDRLKEGDRIASVRSIMIRGKRQKINLTKWANNKIYVKTNSLVKKILSNVKRKHGSLYALAKSLQVNYERVLSWYRGASIPLPIFNKLCKDIGQNLENLKKGIIIKTKTGSKGIKVVGKTSPELLKLVGYIIGDGGIYDAGIQFFNSSKKLRKDFIKLAKGFGLRPREEFPKNRTPKVIIQNKIFDIFLTKVFEIPRNSKSNIVDISDIVMRCSKRELKEFIKALFDSEASVLKKECEIEFSTSSKNIAYKLSSLMRRFGIISRIRKKSYRKKSYYRVVISGKRDLEKYKKILGFTDPEKSKLLDRIIKRTIKYHTNIDTVPVGQVIERILKESQLSIKKVAEEVGIACESLRDIIHGKTSPSVHLLKRIVKGLGKFTNSDQISYLKLLSDSNIFWDTVKKVEKKISKEKFVYDFTVDGMHNFVAGNGGGLIVSNTSFLNTLCMFVPPEAKIVCTTKDSNVLLNDHIQSIGELVDNEMKRNNNVKFQNGIFSFSPRNEIKFYGWNENEFTLRKQKIKKLMKLKPPRKLVRIKTEYGAYVTLTPNTKIPVINENGFSFIRSENINEKCFVPQVSRIDIPIQKPLFDPLEFAKKHNFRVKVSHKLLEKCAKNVGGVNKLVQKLKWRPRKFYQKSFKVEELISLVKVGLNREKIREYMTGVGKYKSMSIFKNIPSDLFYVAGLIITDGYLSKRKKSIMFGQIKNKKIEEKCTSILSKYFGPSTKNNVFYSKIAAYFFHHVFGIPFRKKSRKIVPRIVFSAPEKHLIEFLRGVIDGDGFISKHTITIATSSEKFAEGLVYLLLRLGIIAEHHKRNTTLTKDIHSITVKSVYFDLLAKKLGLNRRKVKYLRKASEIIVLREIKDELKKIMKENKIQIVNTFPQLQRGILAHIFYDKKRRSILKDLLIEIIEKLKEKLPKNKKLNQMYNLLRSTDTVWVRVKEVKLIESKEKFVYDLTPENVEYFPCGRFGFINIQDSIEDTRELKIPNEHWIPGLARVGFGIPTPTGEKYGGVSLFDLLKESFRQNPDYVIVGEVRGKEAYVMFQGMSSIPGWERVMVLNDDQLKKIPIAEFVPKETHKVVAIDPKTEKVRFLPIKARIEHHPRGLLYKIITRTGREVITTPDHSVFTYENGIVPIRVDELNIGSKIVIPARIPCGFNDIEDLNLIQLLPQIRVFAPEYVKKAVRIVGYKRASKLCGVKSISDYYAKFKRNRPSALPASKFFKLMEKAKIEVNLGDIQVRFSKNSKKFPAKIRITPELLRLIGYFISEGSLDYSSRRIALYNKNEKILDDIEHCIKIVANAKPRERQTKGYSQATELSFNHKVLFEFLKIFCGKNSKERKIPDFIFGLSKEKIGQFLSALYAGGGWFFKRSKNYVGYSTQSRRLVEDLLNLLLVFGIVATFKDRMRETKRRGFEVIFYRRRHRLGFLKYVKPIGTKIGVDEVKKDNWRFRNDIFIDEVKKIGKIKMRKPQPVFDLSVQGAQNFIGGFGGVMLHNSGHPCMSTFHAGSVDTVVKRLVTPPIELSPSLIESLDVVVVMIHAREKGKSARRVKEVVEIESVDPKTNEVEMRTVFLWNPATDEFERVADSIKLQKVVAAIGGRLEDALAEIEARKRLLEWLKANNITDYLEVTKYINMYYKEREKLLEIIGRVPIAVAAKTRPRKVKVIKPIAKVREKKIEKKRKREEKVEKRKAISILELLGFKVIKEK